MKPRPRFLPAVLTLTVKAASVLITMLLFTVSSRPAYADGVAAISLIGGAVTQAPAGNVFGVQVGSSIEGEIFWPPNPVSPPNPLLPASCFAVQGCTVTDFTITLTIGDVTYPPDPIAPNSEESVTLAGGLVTGIDFKWPPSPVAPSLTLSGNQFFTTDCAAGAVCGTLDFSNSQVTLTPEPSTIILLAFGLSVLLGVGSKFGPKAVSSGRSFTFPRLFP